LQQPVDDHPAFDAALAVQDKDDFGELGVIECGFDDAVAVADVLGCVVEVALNQALDYVKEDAVSRLRVRMVVTWDVRG
jgi:hypothetical protein